MTTKEIWDYKFVRDLGEKQKGQKNPVESEKENLGMTGEVWGEVRISINSFSKIKDGQLGRKKQ